MFLHFAGSITEVTGKQIRIVAAEVPSSPRQAEMILICNDHNGQRPQFLRPHEVADVFVTFTMPPVSNLEADGTWRSGVTLIDQFGNRHEMADCVFQPDPMQQ